MNGIVLLGLAIFLLVVMMRTIRIVPQKQVKIVERLGKFHRLAEAGMNTIVPFLDSIRATIDLRSVFTQQVEVQPPAAEIQTDMQHDV